MKVLSILSLSLLLASAFAGVSIKEFEEEFRELWSDPNDEKAASQELAKEELEVEKKAANASKKLKLGIGGVIIVIFLISLLFAWMTLP